MSDPIVQIVTNDYVPGVRRFLTSLGWNYLTGRYPDETARRLIVRALTASGLDSWSWERCALRLVTQPHSRITRLLGRTQLGIEDPSTLCQAVEELRAYARQQGEFLGEPPVSPTFLSAFGCTPDDYAADLEAVYGTPVDLRYRQPWDAEAMDPEALPIRPVSLRRAVTIMGATAGAIEQLMAIGAGYGRN